MKSSEDRDISLEYAALSGVCHAGRKWLEKPLAGRHRQMGTGGKALDERHWQKGTG